MLTDKIDSSLLLSVYGSGANGIINEDTSQEVLIQCLRIVELGEKIFPSNTLEVIGDWFDERMTASKNIVKAEADDRIPKLSVREVAILKSLACGATNKQIARDFEIAEGTVKTHVKHILRTIGVRNRTQAAMWAHCNGFPNT